MQLMQALVREMESVLLALCAHEWRISLESLCQGENPADSCLYVKAQIIETLKG